MRISLPDEALAAARELPNVDIVIGIPSYQNARTIQHVARAADIGLSRHFPGAAAVILNSDGGSTDGTRGAFLSAPVGDSRLLFLSHPLHPVHRLSAPYDGIPGKGSAFRLIFQMAAVLEAQACVVVDADLRSITPEWIDLLARPILEGYDFVAPYYHRHKYDGTITNGIVYPLTRALYGARVRQPIGGEFGISRRLVERYLESDDWETEVARFGIDIWMTTTAIAERFSVCQSFLGAKLHDAKDPGSDLSAMLEQVVGSVFRLMERYEPVWLACQSSRPVDLFGFRYDVGLDPIAVDVERMIAKFRHACADLGEIWEMILKPQTAAAIRGAAGAATAGSLEFDDETWVRIVYEFACACKRRVLDRGQLLRSLTPLYLARVASFVLETESLGADGVEEKIESLCRTYEALKPYLIDLWTDSPGGPEEPASLRREHFSVSEVLHD